MDRFISYEGLPLNSGGAHSLGVKDHNEILQSVNEFMSTFSTSSIPDSIQLTFYSSKNKSYSTFRNIFTIIKKHGLIFKYNSWDLKDYRQRLWTWTIPNSKIDKVLKTLDYFSELPHNDYGPVSLEITWKFQFVDLETKQIIPDQDKIPIIDNRLFNSQIFLTLSKKSTISVLFTLPFDVFEKHIDYINKMQNILPFKFSDKNWHQWTLSKNEKWIKRRLAEEFK